jgi:alpha-L-rhamnosidase
VKLQKLLVENLSNPIGVDITLPRLSWQLISDKRNVRQSAYEIKVGMAPDFSTRNLVWSSGKINSDSSVHVTYKGKSLHSGKKYYWQVRVWDNEGKVSSWGPLAYWQMSLLDSTEWIAKWIQAGLKEDEVQELIGFY